MAIRFAFCTIDPVDMIFNGLTIKRPKPKIKEKLLELGLAADRKELRKKRSRKSNHGKCSTLLLFSCPPPRPASFYTRFSVSLSSPLSSHLFLSPTPSCRSEAVGCEALLVLLDPIPFHSHLSFLLSSDSATIPIRSVFC